MESVDEIFRNYERFYFKIFLIVLGYLSISVFMFEGTNSLFGRNLIFFKKWTPFFDWDHCGHEDAACF
jgi:hypothetical protein